MSSSTGAGDFWISHMNLERARARERGSEKRTRERYKVFLVPDLKNIISCKKNSKFVGKLCFSLNLLPRIRMDPNGCGSGSTSLLIEKQHPDPESFCLSKVFQGILSEFRHFIRDLDPVLALNLERTSIE